MLGAHPLVASTSELQLFAQYVAPWVQAWEFHQADAMPAGLPLIFSEEEFMERLRRLVETSYARVLEHNPQADLILSKIPQYQGGVDLLERFLPGSRYVHLIRDGRDVASSLVAASRGWGKRWAPSTVVKAARWWRDGVEAGLEAKRHEGRYLELRYEDLRKEPTAVLPGLLDFLGLDHDDRVVSGLIRAGEFDRMKKTKLLGRHRLPEGFVRKGRVDGWRGDFSGRDRLAFHREAGALLTELGYAEEDWWADRPWDKVVLPTADALGQSGLRRKVRGLLRVLRGSTT